MFEVEDIPAADLLFHRLHDNALREGVIHPGCFRQRGAGAMRGMSTDWDKYARPSDCRNRAPAPESNSVVSFVKGELDGIDGLEVSHAPIPDNRAHTNVRWQDIDPEENARIRKTLYENHKVAIKSPALG